MSDDQSRRLQFIHDFWLINLWLHSTAAELHMRQVSQTSSLQSTIWNISAISEVKY